MAINCWFMFASSAAIPCVMLISKAAILISKAVILISREPIRLEVSVINNRTLPLNEIVGFSVVDDILPKVFFLTSKQ